MKKVITIIIIITFITIILSRRETPAAPVSPSPVPSFTPSPTPRDLEKELESVDPKVLDSDFDE